MGLLHAYSRLLAKHPVATKSVTSAVLFAVGDLTSQWVERSMMKTPFSIDVKRTATMATFGGLFAGPVLHCWYAKILTKWFPVVNWPSTLKKVCLDQTGFSSFFLTCFFIIITVMNGGTVAEGTEKLKKEFWSVMVTNWMIWPGVQLANFGFVPVSYQVLVVNTVAIFWNTYLSYVTFANKTAKASS